MSQASWGGTWRVTLLWHGWETLRTDQLHESDKQDFVDCDSSDDDDDDDDDDDCDGNNGETCVDGGGGDAVGANTKS